ncbi:hypothetical protein RTBOTA2_004493, partial [Rhodotorula toruloides]
GHWRAAKQECRSKRTGKGKQHPALWLWQAEKVEHRNPLPQPRAIHFSSPDRGRATRSGNGG